MQLRSGEPASTGTRPGVTLGDIYAEGVEKMNENASIPQLFRDIFKGVFLPYRDPETPVLLARWPFGRGGCGGRIGHLGDRGKGHRADQHDCSRDPEKGLHSSRPFAMCS